MKKLILSILFLICLLFPSFTHAIPTINCDYLTGGDPRALDYYSVADLSNGTRAIVVYDSGASKYYGYFKYDASGTTVENTSVHPYYVRPNDYTTSGVWYEVVGNFIDLAADVTVTNLTVDNIFTVLNVQASGKLSGGVPYHRCFANYNPSGATLYGGYITGVSEPAGQSGITNIVPSGTGSGENLVFFNERDTYSTGTTLYIHFTSGNTIRCNQTITAGTSKFILFGDNPWDQRIVCISGASGEWTVLTTGTPTVAWD